MREPGFRSAESPRARLDPPAALPYLDVRSPAAVPGEALLCVRVDVLSVLRKILSPEQRRFVKFAIVGGSGVFVNVGVVAISRLVLAGTFPAVLELGALGTPEGASVESAIAIAIGILVSIFTNFVINDRWTWGDRDKTNPGGFAARCARFYLTNGIAASLQLVVSMITLRFWPFELAPWGLDPETLRAVGSSIVGIAVATPLNYLVNNVWTFRDRSSEHDRHVA